MAQPVQRRRIWTSAAGAYGNALAGHALMLMLAGQRGFAELAARATSCRPAAKARSTRTVIVGTGGIGRA